MLPVFQGGKKKSIFKTLKTKEKQKFQKDSGKKWALSQNLINIFSEALTKR